jgi:hypothetical protein
MVLVARPFVEETVVETQGRKIQRKHGVVRKQVAFPAPRCRELRAEGRARAFEPVAGEQQQDRERRRVGNPPLPHAIPDCLERHLTLASGFPVPQPFTDFRIDGRSREISPP